ncbi:MAG TPA: DNA methyltransferase [Ktedonobacterales bacterium]
MADNILYYGDNLDILRHHIPSASVDLIYLDPPFNSNADYNVIFREQSGQRSAAQIKAFTDTWHWDTETDRAREEMLTGAPENVARMLDALVTFIGRNDLTAYLVMMTQRLVELHRVLKPTGSLYLHCDPTASHYLKIVLDSIFGPTNYRGEIVWKRTTAHNDPKRPGRIHDIVLFYTKSDAYIWNKVFTPYSQDYIESHYRNVDNMGRRYRLDNLTAPAHGSSAGQYEWHGKFPPQGRMWSLTQDKMDALQAVGRIRLTRSGMPEYIRYLDEMPGVPLQDVWDDIPPVNPMADERMGYPTQKPLTMLERIIAASSNPGDVVLDPFCGCGTAICAGQRLGRRWIGIDITHLAVSLMKSRLKSMFGLDPSYKAAPGLDPDKQYHVAGEPTDEAGARQLALDDRYQFQYWAVSLVEATAQDAERQQKKGADKGIDGTIAFIDGATRRRETIVVQVKSGHVTSAHIRDLKGVLEREKAAMGLYICLEPPTKDMREEASSAGFYHSALWPGRHGDHRWPRIQLRTIAELLAGQGFEIPPRPVQFKQAERAAPVPGVASPALWDAPASSPAAAGVPVPVPVPDLSDDEDLDDEESADDDGA